MSVGEGHVNVPNTAGSIPRSDAVTRERHGGNVLANTLRVLIQALAYASRSDSWHSLTLRVLIRGTRLRFVF
ncbi:MAG: hypothetical protein ACRC46_01160 [Thermoguttaceae bacterium]